jgi:hypothetical protein
MLIPLSEGEIGELIVNSWLLRIGMPGVGLKPGDMLMGISSTQMRMVNFGR